MRLTKKLRAQVHSMRFASEIATSASFITNNSKQNKEPTNQESSVSPPAAKPETEEKKQLLSPDPTATLKPFLNNTKNSNRISSHNKGKTSTIVVASHSDSCLHDEKQKLPTKRRGYNEDDDSLCSDSMHNEQIIL